MKLDKTQVEHISRLARLGLTEEEKELFASQMSSILDYVEKLNEVDTGNIEPMANITGLESVMRPDEVEDWEAEVKEKLIKSAPETEGQLIKTKPVF